MKTSKKNLAPSKQSIVLKKPENKKSKEDSETDEVKEYEWWNDESFSLDDTNVDNSIKWTTLSHQGVFFAPSYEPINIPINYAGHKEDIYLPIEAEEVAGFFAAMIETDHAKNPKFKENFFKDFLKVLKTCSKSSNVEQKNLAVKALEILKNLDKIDFHKMTQHFSAEREKKKAMTKEQKELIKKEKAEIEEKYGTAIMDGRKEKLGNFRVEPPGLFRGRGDHPKTGKLKQRVLPEQVTLNIGKEAKIPTPPPGHKWGGIVHDNTVAWIATWKENVNDNTKYVLFAATSTLKGQSDLKKFEKARELNKCVESIRKNYLNDLKSQDDRISQRATALYLIDRLALRAGNEKGEDEADTVGCCSLRIEHVDTKEPNILIFDFLGKDSIRYYNEVEVINEIYKNIKKFKKEKKIGDMIFDQLNTTSLNKHLASLMPGLSAKVFRTYNASHTFQEQLISTPTGEGVTLSEKLLAYNRANREVAILCNHQKAVSKTFESQIGRINDRINSLKYQRLRIKKMILKIADSKFFKKNEGLEEMCKCDEGLEKEWMITFVESEAEKNRIKAKQKTLTDKYTEKNIKTKITQIDQDEKEKLAEINSDFKKIEADSSCEKLLAKLRSLDEKVIVAEHNKTDKDENKTTSLGTSKTNYIDPRISMAWAKKNEVPIEKLFNKALLDKFKWASSTKANWVKMNFIYYLGILIVVFR